MFEEAYRFGAWGEGRSDRAADEHTCPGFWGRPRPRVRWGVEWACSGLTGGAVCLRNRYTAPLARSLSPLSDGLSARCSSAAALRPVSGVVGRIRRTSGGRMRARTWVQSQIRRDASERPKTTFRRADGEAEAA